MRLPSGAVLGPEVKSRKRLPRVVVGALAQARSYFGTTAIPLAVVFEFGATDGIACLPLLSFAALVGLDVATLPRSTPIRKPRKSPQLEMFPAAPSCPTGGARS